jgi:hypothetical protein
MDNETFTITIGKKEPVSDIILRLLNGLTLEDWKEIKEDVDSNLTDTFIINSNEKKLVNPT